MSDAPMPFSAEELADPAISGFIMPRALATITDLQAQNTRLREALKFYASEGMWLDDIAPDPAGTPVPYSAPMWSDFGEKARAALTRTSEP